MNNRTQRAETCTKAAAILILTLMSASPLNVITLGYWHHWADKRFGDPPLKVNSAFNGQTQEWKTPRGPSGSALLLCV